MSQKSREWSLRTDSRPPERQPRLGTVRLTVGSDALSLCEERPSSGGQEGPVSGGQERPAAESLAEPPHRIAGAITLGPMGAVDTMELFFERLNAGDREGAVALMAENTEMRVHVGDSVQTLRGIDRVGGWFLRGEKGLRMIPGEVRDLGNTYQADLLVIRPGAPSQHIDASFRVEAGKITSINLAPR